MRVKIRYPKIFKRGGIIMPTKEQEKRKAKEKKKNYDLLN